MGLILSTSIHDSQSVQSWLESINEFVRATSFPALGHAVNLHVQRMGYSGIFPDNPPVDVINQMLEQMEQAELRLGIISVPIAVDVQPQNRGNEISLLNGWTDMAGYTECNHIRFCHTKIEPVEEDMLTFFHEISLYAADLDIAVTFQELPVSFVESIRTKIPSNSRHLLGIEQSIAMENKIALPDSSEHPFVNLLSIHNTMGVNEHIHRLASLECPVLIHI